MQTLRRCNQDSEGVLWEKPVRYDKTKASLEAPLILDQSMVGPGIEKKEGLPAFLVS